MEGGQPGGSREYLCPSGDGPHEFAAFVRCDIPDLLFQAAPISIISNIAPGAAPDVSQRAPSRSACDTSYGKCDSNKNDGRTMSEMVGPCVGWPMSGDRRAVALAHVQPQHSHSINGRQGGPDPQRNQSDSLNDDYSEVAVVRHERDRESHITDAWTTSGYRRTQLSRFFASNNAQWTDRQGSSHIPTA
jgi:hypothetical protein